MDGWSRRRRRARTRHPGLQCTCVARAGLNGLSHPAHSRWLTPCNAWDGRSEREATISLPSASNRVLARRLAGRSTTISYYRPLAGETGTCRELLARAVHLLSRRASQHLSVNIAALPDTLAAAALFGHERGAFTGADRLRVGRFEMADRATLFLDEIGELTADVQVMLLRALQDGEFERLGSGTTRRADVRLIAATNRDLALAMQERRFREDLFYRLNVFPIQLPPLRDRAGKHAESC